MEVKFLKCEQEILELCLQYIQTNHYVINSSNLLYFLKKIVIFVLDYILHLSLHLTGKIIYFFKFR